jgi:hypothetical protein
MFSLVLATFPPQYASYLQRGSQSEEGVFVEVEECGMFELQVPSDLAAIFTLITALQLWLESCGPV